MTGNRLRYVVRYTGRVQGVGFRFTTVAQAEGLKLHGFVRNEPDGSVRMDVEGSAADVKELLRRIESSMSGYIDAAAVDSRPPRQIEGGFRIEY